MASNNSNPKRRRSSQSEDEDQTDKKQRKLSPIASSSPLVNSINIEWSSKKDISLQSKLEFHLFWPNRGRYKASQIEVH